MPSRPKGVVIEADGVRLISKGGLNDYDNRRRDDRERLIRMLLDLDPSGKSMDRLQVLKGYRRRY